MDAGLRGRERRLLTAARARLDPALDLLRLSGRRPAGRGGRRPRLRRPGGRHGAGALGALPLLRAAGLGPRAPAPGPARRSRRSPCARAASWSGRATAHAMEGHGHRPRWLALPARRGRWRRSLVGPYLVLVLLACGLLRAAPSRPVRGARGADLEAGCRSPRGGVVRRDRRPRLDGVQGRRPLLRGRLRDHPADAGRRGQRLPLDDRRAVPERGRLGQVTPGPVVATVAAVGYAAHGIGGGAARGGGRLRALLLLHPARRRALRAPARQRPRAGIPRRRGPAAIGAILGSAVTLAGGAG